MGRASFIHIDIQGTASAVHAGLSVTVLSIPSLKLQLYRSEMNGFSFNDLKGIRR
jgi:hypothetical protein